MDTKQLLMIGVSLLASAAAGPALGQEKQEQYIQVAEIEIDSSQIDAYRTAVKEHIEMAVRVEPGVLTLYAVSDKDDPSKVKVFEIYRDGEAYRRHLESEHFKRYKATTQSMVRSLKLIRTDAIALGAKAR
ncbi:putative quinol monooxygenase [Bradyrhizobium sp. NC92]|uniref:putative quinol monooxygenase n=1 Tax=Bradyrhizobium sp. (strain NC92) TaxID=55395 RepID=UPI0021A9B2DE|nr:putative quinol monooxygenase [Bradyrhizobium sp. NC92]UWU71986.1 antibiotic biosynthesis monooxygenase [Bradyrhizobium sp. NC92]